MRILVAEPIAAAGLAILRERHEVDVRIGLGADELREQIAGYDALVVRSQVQADEPLLRAGARLRVVGRAGVGLDNIDVAAARELGVTVVNAPDGNTIAAAEHTMALLLATARRIPAADASVRRGEWTRSRFQGFELRGRTLGIIGLGRIGRAVAERAAAFGMRILGVDPNVPPDALGRLPVALVDLDVLLAEADVITIHVPLGPETHHLLNRAAISRLRPGAVILNVARGGVVDETALAEALRDGRVGAAAVDVFEHEPPIGSPLLEAPNVVLTPHIAASTAEAQTAVGVEVAQRILEALEAVPAGS